MASTSVIFDILAKDNASSKFDHLSKSVDHSGGALGKFSALAGKAAKAGALALGAGAIIAAKGLYEMGQAAADDDKAARALALTLKNVAGATDAQIASTERWITAQGKAYGVADDDLRPALQRLAEGTGDVAEAQRLASIAMDASAGTGKSLKTISEALLRAMNGSVGGLSRYGIATKDAKGETLTFEQVTAKMAKTFEGQAAKAAETTAGKFARMKLALSEAGESIGYKLLPYASDAATWLGGHLPAALDTLDKKAGPVFRTIVDDAGELIDSVKPAVTEIAKALGHMADQGGDAGDVFHNILLPAVKTTADIVGGLVEFIDELPGPVKKFGAEAAIAAVALSKMNTAIVAFKESEFITSLGTTTGKIDALRNAAKTAAGVAGLAALADGAQQSNDSLAALEKTAGGAAAGFAIGGPWGAAVGAVGGLAASVGDLRGAFYDLLDVQDPAKETQRQITELQKAAADAAERYKVSLDALTGTLDKGHNTAASLAPAYQDVAGQLEAAGISAATADRQWRLLGISQRTVAQASLGNEAAVKAINKAYRNAPLKDRIIDEYTLADAIDHARVTNQQAIKAERQRLRLTQEWGGKLKSFPKEARTAIRLDGVQPTLRGVAKIAAQYKGIDNKDIKTILEITGVDATVADVRKAQDELDKTDKKRPKPELSLSGLPLFSQEVNNANSLLVNLDGNRADTWIYTHHVDLYGNRGGGGGGGGQSQDVTPRMVTNPGRRSSSGIVSPRATTVQHVHEHRFPERMTLRIGHREFEAYVSSIADDRIDQDRSFRESQG